MGRRALIVGEVLTGGVVRYLVAASSYRQGVADRVEVSTFLNSWQRVTEGVALYEEGISPYDGDVFHETPLNLLLFHQLLKWLPDQVGLVFILCDLLTACLLYKTACLFMDELAAKQEAEKGDYAKAAEGLLLTEHDLAIAPLYVLTAYLLNPFVILSCVGYTTTTVANLVLSLVLYSMVHGWRLRSCFFLGLAALQSFYPLILIIPVSIYVGRSSSRKLPSLLLTLATFGLTLAALLYLCHYIMGDWKFLNAIYTSILTVPDLHPNIGLFWYFFTEMFEHFRTLFILAFQVNASLLYLAPLSLRFHSNPMLLTTSLVALMTVFKSYPSLGDVGFYLSLLPMWKHLCTNMQQSFVIVCTLVVTSVLGPTLWHLWIYLQSANANFYFGVTLAFATAQIFLITDLLFSFMKREFCLYSGIIDTDKAHNKIKLLLQ